MPPSEAASSQAAPSSPAQDVPPPPPSSVRPDPPDTSRVPSVTPSSQAQKGSAGAQAVLRTWAQALEDRRFDLAWRQFGTPPASRAAFTKWWERYRTIKVSLGQGEGDAAMGSLYYTAPATLTGTTAEGKPFRLAGKVVVRRVNDVDGATSAQLRWHIDSADLKDVAPHSVR